MTPIDGIDLPPVKAAIAGDYEKRPEPRSREPRAMRLAHEGIHLDEVLRPDKDSGRG